ncbi:FixH family protein [Wenyingzhuangia fucanilytica]|uniref:FixH family protein n=1 Tax=Wenyingzhuangia fucanilytica TaxID=1790137 RepID=UPI00083A987C|nr:FixH family protein [Wenyingzhuangia fucanilytica]
MKINWGTSIVLAFVCFIVFILFFVVKTFTQKEYEFDLVSNQYYEDELAFQKTINNAENTEKLENKVEFVLLNNELKINIPNAKNELIIGEIHFYRPSNKKLDFIKKIASKNNVLTFTSEELVKGRWDVSVTWYYENEPQNQFFKKEQIYF